jgi:hypothetical protein
MIDNLLDFCAMRIVGQASSARLPEMLTSHYYP